MAYQKKSHNTRKRSILVLGIGNILMGNEGIGVKVVNYMQEHFPHPYIDYLDGGTGGFHLLEYFQKYPLVFLVDATVDGQPTGTLSFLRPRFSTDYPPTLTAHDIGLKDMLDSLYLLEQVPEVHLATISIPPEFQMDTELQPELSARVPELAKAIYAYLIAQGIVEENP